MRGTVIEQSINGHVVQYSRETQGWYVCRDCGAKLLSLMQFAVRACPGRPAPPTGPGSVSPRPPIKVEAFVIPESPSSAPACAGCGRSSFGDQERGWTVAALPPVRILCPRCAATDVIA